ncbi:MAG: riboflavin synthase [Candidatus Diapherotrites archaeon]|nr:riboflavin synthase [Candidatus Diapherotrites archaeon]
MADKVGVVDTMFARVDMYPFVVQAFQDVGWEPEIVRRTVPGVKDMPVEALDLLEKEGCAIVLTLGMGGGEPVDYTCVHEACVGIQGVMLKTGKHVIDVIVHRNEVKDDLEFYKLCKNRAYKHAVNAYWLLSKPEELTKRAGTGERQGLDNEGQIAVKK